MTNYRRLTIAGGTYFFTVVTHQRRPWLCTDLARRTLRAALTHIRQKYPFTIDAIVLLPNHLHCIWTLPQGDSDYATRWRLIKGYVTQQAASEINEPRRKRTGYGSRFAPEPQDSDCKFDVSPQSGGEFDPYSIKPQC